MKLQDINSPLADILASSVVFLDAGHGAIHPETGENQTPSRVYRFDPEIFEGHRDGHVYEGVLNRTIAGYTKYFLNEFGINVIEVYDPWEDTDLSERVRLINNSVHLYTTWLTISEHCNGSPGHNADGFEAYTSVGQTLSDRYAELLYRQINQFMPWLPLRTDHRDGDQDKEASFKMVRETIGPAVLIENNFYDSLKGVTLLFTDSHLRVLGYLKALAAREFFVEQYIIGKN